MVFLSFWLRYVNSGASLTCKVVISFNAIRSNQAVIFVALERNIYGLILRTACAELSTTLNSGSVVDVDFGDSMGVDSVDGVSNRVPLNYIIICTGSSVDPDTMALTLTCTMTTFDKYALQTSVGDLGVHVYHGSGSTLMAPDVAVAITVNSPPALEAVLVKKSGITLDDGAFESIAAGYSADHGDG